MTSSHIVKNYISAALGVLAKIDTSDIEKAIEIFETTYRANRVMYIFGNGGSAATSSHLAEDLSKGCACPGKSSFKAWSLTDNTPLLTAISNDFSYEAVFEKQLEILYVPGDTVLAISASGNSKNVLHAVRYAQKRGGRAIGLTGFDGGVLRSISDVNIHVPYDDFGLVEDMHLLVGHILSTSMKKFISESCVS